MSMELLYIFYLKGEWLDFIYTFCQLLPGLVAGALVRYPYVGIDVIYIHLYVCTEQTQNVNETNTDVFEVLLGIPPCNLGINLRSCVLTPHKLYQSQIVTNLENLLM